MGTQDINSRGNTWRIVYYYVSQLFYSTGLHIKLDLKFHVLHTMLNCSESMFGLKPRLMYAALLLSFTALSSPPRSDAIDADILVSLPLNLLSLSANVGCSTPCRPVFHATVLARYPLSYTFKNSKTSTFPSISTKSLSYSSFSSLSLFELAFSDHFRSYSNDNCEFG